MIKVEEVEHLGNIKEKENLRFRRFLKNKADEEELDKQFKELHNKVFARYDCLKCRNCCKKYGGSFSEEDIMNASSYLEMARDVFINNYLEFNEFGGSYNAKNIPCNFLEENGNCLLNGSKPVSCKEYPYTNKEERLFSLYSIMDNTKICPAVYEIVEELKKIYNFK